MAGGARPAGTELSRLAREPRFPLAGPRAVPDQSGEPARPEAYFPVFASLLPGPWLGALVPAGSARTRDGLTSFDAAHFLDPNLRGVRMHALVGQADHLRYTEGKDLRGVHALLGIDDVTLVAAPDAVHVGWARAPRPRPPEPRRPKPEADEEPEGRFEACAPDLLPIPRLTHEAGMIAWPAPPQGASVQIEEAHDEASEIVTKYRDKLDMMVERLLEKESLEKEEVSEILADRAAAPSPFGDDQTFPLPVEELTYTPTTTP